MKRSRYNIFIDLPRNGIRLAFNSRSLALVEFSLEERALIDQILDEPGRSDGTDRKYHSIKRTLIEGGFLIDDSIDELNVLKTKNRTARFSGSHHMGLTIAPTLNCNFRCTYCYEQHRKGKISLATMKALLGSTEKSIIKGNDLFVTWFGGEPLLALNEMAFLSKGFLAMTRRSSAKYSAYIVTNGFLLDRGTARKLKRWGVTGAQITIDGPKTVHDKRRPLASGKGTFERVFENIKNSWDLLKIDVRINVDKDNIDTAFEVVETLEKEGLKNRVYPYLGCVFPYTDVCADIQSHCFRKDEFSLLVARLKFALLKRGFKTAAYPQLKGAYCTADSLNSQVISPSGTIVKCWNHICDEGESVGHALSSRMTSREEANTCKWLAWDPFEKPDCRRCKILPICMGGCPYLAFKSGLKNRGDCIDFKYNLKEILSLFYLQKKQTEEHEVIRALAERVEALKKDA
jgi:uncharacterized protein